MTSERILIVGPAWVGDMVMAQSLYRLLHERKPRALIDVLAPAWSLPLLARMPEVHRGIEVPLGHGEFGFGKRLALGKSLRGEHHDRAIVLPRSLKSALIPFFAGAKRRSGYKGEMRYGLINDMRALDKGVLSQTVQRYLALGMDAGESLPPSHIPRPQLRVDKANQQRCMQLFGLHADRPVVGMMPGAEYGPAKQWPVAYYAETAAELVRSGHQVWIFGSKKDLPVAGEIAKQAGDGVVNLAGCTQLVDVVDLIACCKAVVCNDSGLMHVAAAVGTPLVAVYGSSTPDYTPPLTDQARVLYRRLDCSPCFKRECPLGHTECLTGIQAQEVLDALHDWL